MLLTPLEAPLSSAPHNAEDYAPFIDESHNQNQPDLPNADTFIEAGTYLVYLDVWRRHITVLDDTDIREKALGGPDTTTRIKTVWQVKLQKVDDTVTCSTKLSDWPPTDSSGKLTAHALGADYEGLENHLYRVEIHEKGALDTATFKWSRDNGSVIAAIKTISTSNISATIFVENLALDEVHGFAVNQWVEIINDVLELAGKPGQYVQITGLDPALGKFEVRGLAQPPKPPLPVVDNKGADNEEYNKKYHSKLRRWDSAGRRISPDGESTDAPLVQIPADKDGYITLENGVEVKFSQGDYATGDYWLIPARAAIGDIEWPVDDNNQHKAQPPRGIQHHCCRLALLELQGSTFNFKEDCRTIFQPPATLVEDTLGLNAAAYQRGQGRPKVNLRAAINALVRGGLPMTPEKQVFSETQGLASFEIQTVPEGRGSGLDSDIWLFWTWCNFVDRFELWSCRYQYDTSSWVPELRSADANSARTDNMRYLSALKAGGGTSGDIWVFWRCDRRGDHGSHSLWYTRYRHYLDGGAWDEPVQLTITNDTSSDEKVAAIYAPSPGPYDSIWVVWLHKVEKPGSEPIHQIWVKRYKFSYFPTPTGIWEEDTQITAEGHNDRPGPVIALDGSNNIWVFWVSDRLATRSNGGLDIYSKTYNGTAWGDEECRTSDVDCDRSIGTFFLNSVLCDRRGDLWLFYSSSRTKGSREEKGIYYLKYNHINKQWDDEIHLTNGGRGLVAMEDNDDIWVVWGDVHLWCKRYNKELGCWTKEFEFGDGGAPSILNDVIGNIRVFWWRSQDWPTKHRLMSAQFILAI